MQKIETTRPQIIRIKTPDFMNGAVSKIITVAQKSFSTTVTYLTFGAQRAKGFLRHCFFTPPDPVSTQLLPPSKRASTESGIPPFAQTRFDDSWDKVYIPLFNQLLSLGVMTQQGDWTQKMSLFLEFHDIWFENNTFHVGKKTDEPKNDIETFYALLSLAYENQDNYEKMLSIKQLLIRPFLKRIPEPIRLATYGPFQMALFRSRKRAKMEHGATSVAPTEKAAITIQRAVRQLQAKEIHYPPHLGSYSYPLNPNPPVPLTSNAILQEKANAWIEAHEESLQNTARKFIQNIRHISFSQFTDRLRRAVESFNRRLTGLPEEQRKFVIVIPQHKVHSSNKWTTELALPFFKKPPEDIILSSQLNAFLVQNPQVKQVVLVDDAVYSGKQMSSYLQEYRKIGIQYHVIVPYTTSPGLRRIAGEQTWISDHEMIFCMEDLCNMGLFSEEEQQVLKNAIDEDDRQYFQSRSLTYFDHKIADGVSTYNNILSYGCLLQRYKLAIPFIPETIPPYQKAI